jgi:anaphase-promoting complex subunit 10
MSNYTIDKELPSTLGAREIGKQAIWTLSSAKTGNGVHQLRDDNMDTFWQSDGKQPHLVTIQFLRKTRISEISFYVDERLDESYTPLKVAIRAGSSPRCLEDLDILELDKPIGWVRFTTSDLKCHIIQLAVLASHQNGKDTHIRQIKVFSPASSTSSIWNSNQITPSSVGFGQYSCIR